MPQYGLFYFGLYLTLMAKVDSFVLLTANYEDLKRLAQKFVPESVVENIAEFISKATNGVTGSTNLSKENEDNYEHRNKASRDNESDSKNSEDSQLGSNDEVTSKKVVPIDSIQLASLEQFHHDKRKATYDRKSKKEPRYQSRISEDSKSNKVDHQTKKKSSTTSRDDNNDSDLTKESNYNVDTKSFTAGLDFNNQKIKNFKEINNNLDRHQEASKENNMAVEDKRSEVEANNARTKSRYAKRIKSPKNKIKSKRKYSKSIEYYDVKDKSADKYLNVKNVNRSAKLTTRVERNEFDQYYDKNYPKSHYVLGTTSGTLGITMYFD